jgi:hypothetical protein
MQLFSDYGSRSHERSGKPQIEKNLLTIAFQATEFDDAAVNEIDIAGPPALAEQFDHRRISVRLGNESSNFELKGCASRIVGGICHYVKIKSTLTDFLECARLFVVRLAGRLL